MCIVLLWSCELKADGHMVSHQKSASGIELDCWLRAHQHRSCLDVVSASVLYPQAGGTVASWSTGYALDATARIPSTAPAIRMDLFGFIVSTAICLNIFVISLFLLI
ncbi:unnamed protein product [Taenia asiatica]|uniref:Uncharacterized protein n=1 Tax=Taenia asiatica TaxID=60517 RepID=A0A0R3VXW7_TAEAS|nr:unnamed protein product [Taenia asiatica]